MKSLIASAILCLGSMISTQASTINFSTDLLDGSLTFQNSTGSVLADGSLVRIGYFANEMALTLGMSVTEMESAGGWIDFGALSLSSPLGISGKIVGSSVNNSEVASQLSGLQIFLWVFDSADPSTASATGIFRATDAENSWLFPTNAFGLGDSITLNMDDLSFIAIDGFGMVNWGSGTAELVAIAVPESSTNVLMGLCLLLLGGYQIRCRRAAYPNLRNR